MLSGLLGGVLAPSWSASFARSFLVPECGARCDSMTQGLPTTRTCLHRCASHEVGRDLTLSFSFLLFLLSLSLLDVFLSWNHNFIWLYFLCGSSTTVWSMRVLVVFGDSTMPRGLLQKSPSLNHQGHHLPDSRRRGDCDRHLPFIVIILVCVGQISDLQKLCSEQMRHESRI